MSSTRNYAGIIEKKLERLEHVKRENHWAMASTPDGVLAYLPVVYVDRKLAGKVYDISTDAGAKATVYAERVDALCRDKSVKRIRLGSGACATENGMLLRKTMVAMHPELAKLLRLDPEAPTVQYVIVEEWKVEGAGGPDEMEIDWM